MRPMMVQVKKRNNKHNLIGVEIGVKIGKNAKDILINLPMRKLYLIDPYQQCFERGFLWKNKYSNFFNEAEKNLSKFKEKIKFVKKKSEDAIDDIPNNLDFVYIDGNHTYRYVKKDLELYYPKVKDGGVIGGHDIHSPNVLTGIMGFCLNKGLLLNINMEDLDWWVIKDKSNIIKKKKIIQRDQAKLIKIKYPYYVLKHIVSWTKNIIKTVNIKGNIFY